MVWFILFLIAFRECTREIEGFRNARRPPGDRVRQRHYLAGLAFSVGGMLLALTGWGLPLAPVGFLFVADGFVLGMTVPCSVGWITKDRVRFAIRNLCFLAMAVLCLKEAFGL
jgi:hypothetical protein